VKVADLRSAVLEWYRPRRPPEAWGRGRRSPYRVLVSEVMLQQTQASRVEPIYEAFLERFPDVAALAASSRAAVLRSWAGLGYNRRAIALHDAARVIVRRHRGRVPRDADALRGLPGVGPYTAAAVASIGFGEAVASMDTNARRICARVVHGAEPDEVPASELTAVARAWLDPASPGEWNQALMDLGRVVCRPAPRCDACPLSSGCRFRALGRRGRPSGRRQSVFEGSVRQIRGAVVDVLRSRSSLDPDVLPAVIGRNPSGVAAAAEALIKDGITERTRSGRIRLSTR
jgi:A/G-specific adenine glycosylase